MISKEKNICTEKEKKSFMAYNAGKKNLHRYMTVKILNQTKSPTPPLPLRQMVDWVQEKARWRMFIA